MTITQFTEYLSSSDNFYFQDGIWYSTGSSHLSYPENGHADCFEIEENSFWFHHRNNCLISVITRFTTENLFFDVGGGNGFVTKAINNAQIQTVLVEPGKSGVLNAKKRNLENVFCGFLRDLQGLAGQIPSIGAFDVIEHIQDDDAFVKEIHHMLKTGGTFFVTVPAFQFLWSDEDRDAGHFRRYKKDKITTLLKNNNFDLIYSTYIFSFLVLPLFIIRSIPSKLGIRKKSKTRTEKEHNQNNGFIGKILDIIWQWELRRIKDQKSVPFGTSCLLVAKKKKVPILR
jgi:SAM-dependent methyltransferase